MGATECPQTCPMGPPGPQGITGQKGDSGSKGNPGQKGETATSCNDEIKDDKGEPANNRDWCNLLDAGEILAKTVVSTSKNIIMLKKSDKKNFQDADILCKYICGRIYFPSSFAENNEVFEIAKKSANLDTDDIWLRLSDQETEGIWKDPDNRETLTFENWDSGQPNDKWGQEHVNFKGPGKWNDYHHTHKVRHVICEL